MVEIGRKDVVWNYLATFLKMASSALLLPAILHKMPSEMVGMWTIFITISLFSTLLDFGFNASFTRNVSYVFSGVRSLKVNGFERTDTKNAIDYSLLKGLISSMRWFYTLMALVVLVLLLTLGTWYIHHILITYKGDLMEVYVAWFLLCLINAYGLYTYYYDALLQGIGFIKVSKQITIIGQSVYLAVAFLLIYLGFGLVAIVSAQIVSVVIIRVMSYRVFFSSSMKEQLDKASGRPKNELLKAIYPNAVKIGLTSLGGFLISRSSMVIGSFYLTLEQIASYGITLQLINMVVSLASIYTSTYQAKMVQWRVEHNVPGIRAIYVKGQGLLFLTFLVGGGFILFVGPWALSIIHSDTKLMSFFLILLALTVSLLETNHCIAGNILLTKNEVPFFKASLISGGCIVVGLLFVFNYLDMGLYSLMVVPLLVDIAYQSWKWPLEAHKDLHIRLKDYLN